MKTKILALIVCSAAAFTGLQAQDQTVKPTRDPAVQQQREVQRSNSQSDVMAEKLGLNDDQKAAMRDLDEQYASSMRELRSSTTDREQMRAKAEELNANRDARLKHLLTPEQFEKLMEMRKGARDESRAKEMEIQKAAE
jgi:Spy/CpxP family protein refolding chaperone